MTNRLTNKLFIICWELSICSYLISFFMPVFGVANSIELNWGEGFTMFLMGWLTILIGGDMSGLIQFLVWSANPIYITLLNVSIYKYLNKTSFVPTLRQKLWAITGVLLGSLFYLYGEIILDEGGSASTITSFHIGYWLWWGAMVLLATALVLQNKAMRPKMHWQKYAIAFALLVFVMLNVGVARFTYASQTFCKNPMIGRTYSSYYQTSKRIEVTFTSDVSLCAKVYSMDDIGRGEEIHKGYYSYDAPYVNAQWDWSIDMKYAIYNKDADELIIYGWDDTYYLSRNGQERHNLTNWPLLVLHEIAYEANDYLILAKRPLIGSYGTEAQELHLPEGYHLTYPQILERQLQKLHYDPEYCDCFTTEGREEDWLNYEDDSLQIIFERMCIQTKGNQVVGFRDYSVIPEVIYDKRKERPKK